LLPRDQTDVNEPEPASRGTATRSPSGAGVSVAGISPAEAIQARNHAGLTTGGWSVDGTNAKCRRAPLMSDDWGKAGLMQAPYYRWF
jgi:hypothetical protein